MNASIMFMPVGQDRVVAKLAAAILEDGASASVVAPEGAGKTAVLDVAVCCGTDPGRMHWFGVSAAVGGLTCDPVTQSKHL